MSILKWRTTKRTVQCSNRLFLTVYCSHGHLSLSRTRPRFRRPLLVGASADKSAFQFERFRKCAFAKHLLVFLLFFCKVILARDTCNEEIVVNALNSLLVCGIVFPTVSFSFTKRQHPRSQINAMPPGRLTEELSKRIHLFISFT